MFEVRYVNNGILNSALDAARSEFRELILFGALHALDKCNLGKCETHQSKVAEILGREKPFRDDLDNLLYQIKRSEREG